MKYIQGDLLQALENNEVDIILHQCNCFGIGAGVAKSIVSKWPIVNRQDIDYRKIIMPFGTNLIIDIGNNREIVNMYAQYHPGPCKEYGIDSFIIRKAALEQCLLDLPSFIKDKRIGIPLVASGLASDMILKTGLSDLEYFQMYIADIFKEYLPNVNVYYL